MIPIPVSTMVFAKMESKSTSATALNCFRATTVRSVRLPRVPPTTLSFLLLTYIEVFHFKYLPLAIPQMCEDKNGACEHYCEVMKNSVLCSCAKGYKLAADGKSCRSDGKGMKYGRKENRTDFIHSLLKT